MRRAPVVAVAAAVVTLASAGAAQEGGDATGSLRVFAQPASGDALLVVTPSVTGNAKATKWLAFDVDWTADIVTGATPRTYGSPDVVSAATSFIEMRNVVGAGATVTAGPATLSAGYSYGTEHDYRSHLIRFGATLDLFNHNTTIAADYSHSFDSVCDLAQANVPVTLRQPLDNSTGCFTGIAALTEEPLAIDHAELTVSQTLTPSLLGSLGGTYQHLDGFQSNPYRRVRLDGGLLQAQESHPRLRDRGAATARLRWAVAKLTATLGGDVRLYRDSWGVQSITSELSWEMPFRHDRPAWRWVGRTRLYAQSSADFYRDVGWENSYERAGPVGNYFTADQELAPLADLLVGFRAVHTAAHDPEHRKWKMFTNVEWSFALDYLKIFALSPEPPNAARMRSFASALVLTIAGTGGF